MAEYAIPTEENGLHYTAEVAGTEYRSHRYLAGGDYDGSGSVERANIEAVLHAVEERGEVLWAAPRARGIRFASQRDGEPPPAGYLEEGAYEGAYGWRRLWVRADLWDELELDALDDYPVFDEDKLSEWEWNAIEAEAPFLCKAHPALLALPPAEFARLFFDWAMSRGVGWYVDAPDYATDDFVSWAVPRARAQGLRHHPGIVAAQFRRFAPRVIRRGRQVTLWDLSAA